MKTLLLALALVGATSVSAMAADGCGPNRHFSGYVGHCVWNRYSEAPGYYGGPDYYNGGPSIFFDLGGIGGFNHHHRMHH